MATKKPKNPKEAKLKYYSPDGNYKTKITKKYGEDEKVKETRTLKGVLRGVNKPSIIKEEPKAEPKLYQAKKGGATDKKWIQKATASIKKRGTAGKCTPITKPGCTGKAKALAKTFKKIAKNR